MSSESSIQSVQKDYRPPNPRQLTKALRQASAYSREGRSDGHEDGIRRDDINGLEPPDTAPTPPGEFENVSTTLGTSWPSGVKWRKYFLQEVAGDKYLEFQLLLMTLVTGCMDVMTYTTYGVFYSKQTGNTMLVALDTLNPEVSPPGHEDNVGMSIGMFVVGALFFGHIGHISRQRLRVWLLASNAFQALLALAAAAVRYFTPRTSTGPSALAIVAILSFAESGQIATALNVNMPELNTTMITGALIQLCTDCDLLKLRNPKRNRRLAFFVSLLIGCFIGSAALANYSPSFVLVIIAALKGALVITFFFNRGIVPKVVSTEDGCEETKDSATPIKDILFGD